MKKSRRQPSRCSSRKGFHAVALTWSAKREDRLKGSPGSRSRRQPVLMNQPAQGVVPENSGRWTSALDAMSVRRRHEMKAPVRSVVRVMADVGPEHTLEVPRTVDQDVVQAFSPYGPHEPLGERVRPRRPDRRSDDPDALRLNHLVERPENVASGSRSRNRIPESRPSMARFLACWVTQAESGWG